MEETPLTVQGYLNDLYSQPWIASGGDISLGGTSPLPNALLTDGVTIRNLIGWFPSPTVGSGGRLQQSQDATFTSSSNPALATNRDNIIYWNGTTTTNPFVVKSVGIGSPAPTAATDSSLAGYVQLYRITTGAATITQIYDIREKNPDLPYLDPWWFGARPYEPGTAVVPADYDKNTQAINACLAIAALGDGTNWIHFGHVGRYICSGQLTGWGHRVAGNVTSGNNRGLLITGTPSGGNHQNTVEGGVILDLRWDGGIVSSTGLNALNDYVAIEGFEPAYTFTQTTVAPWYQQMTGTYSAISFGKGTQSGNRAYINNGTYGRDSLITIPDTPVCNFGGISPPAPGYVAKYFIDIDQSGNAYACPTGLAGWTDTSIDGTQFPIASQSIPVAGPSTLTARGQSKTPDTIRVATVWIDANRNIVGIADSRPVTGKMDFRAFGTVRMRDITLTKGWFGQWNGNLSYHAGQYVFAATEGWLATGDTGGSSPPSAGGQSYWARVNTLTVGGRDLVPFIHATAANLELDGVAFFGPSPAGQNGPALIDAVVLGGPGSPSIQGFNPIDSPAVYSGYGATISRLYMDQIRKGIWARRCSQITIRDCYAGPYCGAGDLEGFLQLENCNVINVGGNKLESRGYMQTFKLGFDCARVNLFGDNFSDAWTAGLVSALPANSTSLLYNGAATQFPDITPWKGKQVILSTFNNSGNTNPGIQEVVTIANAAFSGTPIGTGAALARVQPDVMTLITNQDLGSLTRVGVNLGTNTNEEILQIVGTTTTTYGGAPLNLNANTEFGYRLLFPSRVLHGQNSLEPVTQPNFTVPLTSPTLVPHNNGDSVSRSIACMMAEYNYAYSGGAPAGAWGVCAFPFGVFPPLDKNGETNGYNIWFPTSLAPGVQSGGPTSNLNLRTILPYDLKVQGVLSGQIVQGVNTPGIYNKETWTLEPDKARDSVIPSSGTPLLVKLYIPTTKRYMTATMLLATGAAGLTANQNFLAAYNSAGTQLWATAAGTLDTLWTGSAGKRDITIPGVWFGQAGTWIWLYVLTNYTVGGPAFQGLHSTSVDAANLGLANTVARCGTLPGGRTSPTTSITPSSITLAQDVICIVLS